MMHIDRRQFTFGIAGFAATVSLPIPSLAKASPQVFGFRVGTPGERNWIITWVKDANAAREEWMCAHGYDEEDDLPWFEVEREPSLDKFAGVGESGMTDKDYMDINWMVDCSRCFCDEVSWDVGRVVDGKAVCYDCMTASDWEALGDHDEAEHYRELGKV